jgi:hypothetical protein
MEFKHLIPFIAILNEKNIGTQKLIFSQVRILCEGGTKIWKEDLSIDIIINELKTAGLEVDKQVVDNDSIFFKIKSNKNIDSIESWRADNNCDSEQLYWRTFNFVLQQDYNKKYQYYTPVPNTIYLEPFTVIKLLNTILKVYQDIDIE